MPTTCKGGDSCVSERSSGNNDEGRVCDAALPEMAVGMHVPLLMHTRDILFRVIFGADHDSVLEMVHASAVRLYSLTGCKCLAGMMNAIVSQRVLHGRSGAPSAEWGPMIFPLACEGSCVSAQGGGVPEHQRHQRAPDVLKALFFLFLNVDMVLKEYVCNPGSRDAFCAAMNIKPTPGGAALSGSSSAAGTRRQQQQQGAEDECMRKLHACKMMSTAPVEPARARSFFVVLHDKIVRAWLHDERLHATDLVQMVKEEYLVC